MVTCEHCGMTFINKACVTKHIRNGKCPKYVPPKTYKELQAENDKLRELLEEAMPVVYNTYRSDDLGPKSLPCRIEQALERKPQ